MKKYSICAVIIIVACFVHPIGLYAQNYYQRLYGDTCHDEGYSIYLDNDSSLIMAGYSCSYINGSDDVYLIHTTLNGALIWSTAVNMLDQERAYSVIEDHNRNGAPIYIVTGDTKSNQSTKGDAFLMDVDQYGTPSWVETFSRSTRDDHGRCVIKTSDKNYLAVGYSNTCDSVYQDTCVNCHDVFLFETDLTGALQWAEYVDIAGGDDYAYKVVETNKKYYVTGYTRLRNQCNNTDVFLMQVDPSGTIDWVKTYGDSLGDFAYSITATPDTGLLMVGHTLNYSTSTVPDVLAIKTDLNGIPKWKTTYNSNPNNHLNYGRDVVVKSQGYYIAGYSDIKSSTSFDMQLINITTTGLMVWQRAYGGTSDDRGYALVELNNGAAIVGYTYSYGKGLDDVYLVRTNPQGECCEYPIDTNFRALDTLYRSPNFTEADESIYSSIQFQYVNPVRVDSLCYDTSSHRYGYDPGFELAVSPNPVIQTENLVLQMQSHIESHIEIDIYNMMGQQIMRKERELKEGENHFEIETNDLVPGVYLLSIDGMFVQKVIVQGQ